MAISSAIFNDARLRVVAYLDDAIDHEATTREDYEKYLETLDEEVLTFATDDNGVQLEPTRFVMKKFLSEHERSSVVDSQISMDADKNVKIRSTSEEELIRRALVDIENPPGADSPLQWEKDRGDRWASKELVTKLAQVNILSDLSTARSYNVKSDRGLAIVKKS